MFPLLFFEPFLCNDFDVQLPIVQTIDQPCEGIIEVVDKLTQNGLPFSSNLTDVCRKHAQPTIQSLSMDLLQHNLGSMRDLQTHKLMTWPECLHKMENLDNFTLHGQCCKPVKSPVEACTKIWMAKDMGLGEKKITEIIEELFQKGDVFLGFIIIIFSIIFPIFKVMSTITLSLSPKNRDLRNFVQLVSKWSMADVFIAALSIVFFKSSSLGFAFTPQNGLYLFAAGAILSSIAVMLLPKGTVISQITLEDVKEDDFF